MPYEAAYAIEVPECVPTCGHLLPDGLVREICQDKVSPMNPHAQRLLAAEVRAANPAKAKAKAKAEPKSKAKAKADPKNKEKAEPREKAKSSKRSKDGGNEISPTRSEYSTAKKAFMDKKLHRIHSVHHTYI